MPSGEITAQGCMDKSLQCDAAGCKYMTRQEGRIFSIHRTQNACVLHAEDDNVAEYRCLPADHICRVLLAELTHHAELYSSVLQRLEKLQAATASGEKSGDGADICCTRLNIDGQKHLLTSLCLSNQDVCLTRSASAAARWQIRHGFL